jgi:SAM-dependent methyltransferase
MSERILGTDDSASWEAIYQADDAGWDIGAPAPPFVDLLAQPPAWLSPGRLLVPGCGAGHDAAAFAAAGFDVTAVDFAPSAVRLAREKGLNVVETDFLTPVAEFANQFDYVLEHTCFCAIPLARRPHYVAAARAALKPGGTLLGLFYRFDPPDADGPPFALSEAELRAAFEPSFEILAIRVPTRSHGRRHGRERFLRMRRAN